MGVAACSCDDGCVPLPCVVLGVQGWVDMLAVLGMRFADVCGLCSLLPDGVGGGGALLVGGGVLRVRLALAAR